MNKRGRNDMRIGIGTRIRIGIGMRIGDENENRNRDEDKGIEIKTKWELECGIRDIRMGISLTCSIVMLIDAKVCSSEILFDNLQ